LFKIACFVRKKHKYDATKCAEAVRGHSKPWFHIKRKHFKNTHYLAHLGDKYKYAGKRAD